MYRSKSNFTRFTLENLIVLLSRPSLTILKAFTNIIVFDHQSTLFCLNKVMEVFLLPFKNSDNPALLFNLIDTITYYCKGHILLYVSDLLTTMWQYVHDVRCFGLRIHKIRGRTLSNVPQIRYHTRSLLLQNTHALQPDMHCVPATSKYFTNTKTITCSLLSQ